MAPVTLVCSMLVRNEDLWVEQAVRNAVDFCDRFHILDHYSTDETWPILSRLAAEYGRVELERSRDARRSHQVLEQYANTPTWVLAVDGDELYDPDGLARLRELLAGGGCADAFRVRPWILHCTSLDLEARQATGHLSPPSRVVGRLFNFAAVASWTGGPERLHGEPVFNPGFGFRSEIDLNRLYTWEDDPLHYLHLCFLRRSSNDPSEPTVRRNLAELGTYDRTALGGLKRLVRPHRLSDEGAEVRDAGLAWKEAKYARGESVTVDATPFLRGLAG